MNILCNVCCNPLVLLFCAFLSVVKRDTMTFSAQPLRVAGWTHVSLSQPHS